MQLKGPWSAADVDRFLRDTIIPVRLGLVRPDGDPLVASLWFVSESNVLWCATSRGSYVAQILLRNQRSAFEVASEAPPYRGVRGRGKATLHPDQGPRVLQQLIDRYSVSRTSRLGRYLLGRADNETAIRIEMGSIVSWDFSERMSDWQS